MSGVGVGQCPRRQNFALEIPTCWYILALPNAKICVSPDANPRRQSVEYRCRWVFWRWPCIFHVYFMYILCIFHVYFMLFVHMGFILSYMKFIIKLIFGKLFCTQNLKDGNFISYINYRSRLTMIHCMKSATENTQH